MAARKSRDPRQRVQLPARMRAGAVWTDVTIQNVSRRGLMACCERPPRRGDYVELHKADQTIVARVVWAGGGSFGVRAQDDIDIAALTGQRPTIPYAGPERRRKPRRSEPPASPAVAWERSRRVGSLVDFAVVGLIGLAAAAFLFIWVQDTLGEPAAKVARAFAGATTGEEG